MKHALVVGGTGMLAEVCLWLVKQDYHVSVIGRNTEKVKRLIEKTENGKITPLLVDYKDVNLLGGLLKKTIHDNGAFTLVVAWVHTGGELGLAKMVETVAETSEAWRLYHILGSRAKLDQIRKAIKIPSSCSYHQVQLGFKVEKGQGRWLTNQEIAAGVIEALEHELPVSYVGVLEPEEMRP